MPILARHIIGRSRCIRIAIQDHYGPLVLEGEIHLVKKKLNKTAFIIVNACIVHACICPDLSWP